MQSYFTLHDSLFLSRDQLIFSVVLVTLGVDKKYYRDSSPMKETRTQTSYIFWLACLLQLHGLHRIYNGKIGTGLLWMCTFGFLGVGQFLDLFLIPGMVEEHNLKLRLGISPYDGLPLNPTATNPTLVKPSQESVTARKALPNSSTPITQEELMIRLAKVASRRGGQLSVTQAVIETGISFSKVEEALKEMVKKGYVGVDNHPKTGAVIYEFLEL